MTQKRKSTKNRDGINIRDQWAAKKRQVGKQWLYRVWDGSAHKYHASVFNSDPDKDAGRSYGCEEGDAWAKRMQAMLVLGQHPQTPGVAGPSSAKVNLQSLGERFLLDRGNRGAEKLSDEYLEAVRWTLKRMAEAGIGDFADENLAERLTAWFGTLTSQRAGQRSRIPVSARTKNAHLAILNTIANFGVRRKIIPYNPFQAVDKFKQGKTKRPIYSIWDLRTIVADEHRGDPWWPHMVFAAYTGIRSESIRKVTWNMVEWDARRFHFPKSILKTNADVHATIQDELYTLLVTWRGNTDEKLLLPLFCTRVDSSRANILTQRYLESVNIPRNGRSVHTFRHTAASLLTATGENTNVVMDIIGHDSVNTSQHYSKGASELRDQVTAERWGKAVFYLRRTPPGLEPFPLVLIQKMVEAVNQTRAWWKFIVLAVYTGLRDPVLGKLTWSMCDLTTRTMRIPAKLMGTEKDVELAIQTDLANLLYLPTFSRQTPTLLPPEWADAKPDATARRTQAYWEDLGISTNARTVEAFWNTVTCLHIAIGREAPSHWAGRLGMIYADTIRDLRREMAENGWAPHDLNLLRTPRRKTATQEGNLVG